ncbi:MAG: hypothetical protein V1916_00955 [Patescibacteria group bacterium]
MIIRRYAILAIAIAAGATLLLSLPMAVSAQGANNAAGTGSSGTPSLPNPLLPPGTGNDKPVNVLTIMLRIMQIALALVDIFALFMFILGGFEFLISAGNPTMIKRAKDTLVWAVIGIVVITLSYSILKFIFEGVTKGIGS